MSSDIETLGKDIGNDIRNGKKTLIAVHALQNVSKENKALFHQYFGNKKATQENIKQIFSLFHSLGSIEYVKQTAEKYSEKAKQALTLLSDSDTKNILIQLADYAIQRDM
jgi:geranylgeranyl diphosphate synthase type I